MNKILLLMFLVPSMNGSIFLNNVNHLQTQQNDKSFNLENTKIINKYSEYLMNNSLKVRDYNDDEDLNNEIHFSDKNVDFMSRESNYYEYYEFSEMNFKLNPTLFFNNEIIEIADKPINVNFNYLQKEVKIKITDVIHVKNLNINLAIKGELSLQRQHDCDMLTNFTGYVETNSGVKLNCNEANLFLNFKINDFNFKINKNKPHIYNMDNINNVDSEKPYILKLYRGMTPTTSYSKTFLNSPHYIKEDFINNFESSSEFIESGNFDCAHDIQNALDKNANNVLINATYSETQISNNKSEINHKKIKIEYIDDDQNDEYLRINPNKSEKTYINNIESLLNAGSEDKRFIVSFSSSSNKQYVDFQNNKIFDNFYTEMKITDSLNNVSKTLKVLNVVINNPYKFIKQKSKNIFDESITQNFNFTFLKNVNSDFLKQTDLSEHKFKFKNTNQKVDIKFKNKEAPLNEKPNNNGYTSATFYIDNLNEILDLKAKNAKIEYVSDNCVKFNFLKNVKKIDVYSINSLESITLNILPYLKEKEIKTSENDYVTNVGIWNLINNDFFSAFDMQPAESDIQIFKIKNKVYFRSLKECNKKVKFISRNSNRVWFINVNAKKNDFSPLLEKDINDLDLSKRQVIKISNFYLLDKVTFKNYSNDFFNLKIKNNYLIIEPKVININKYDIKLRFSLFSGNKESFFDSSIENKENVSNHNFDIPDYDDNNNDNNNNNNDNNNNNNNDDNNNNNNNDNNNNNNNDNNNNNNNDNNNNNNNNSHSDKNNNNNNKKDNSNDMVKTNNHKNSIYIAFYSIAVILIVFAIAFIFYKLRKSKI